MHTYTGRNVYWLTYLSTSVRVHESLRLASTVAKSHTCRLHYFASRATRTLYYDVFATFPVKKFNIGRETVFDSRQAFTPRRACLPNIRRHDDLTGTHARRVDRYRGRASTRQWNSNKPHSIRYFNLPFTTRMSRLRFVMRVTIRLLKNLK